MVGLHLIGFVEAILARIDACSFALAAFFWVYREREVVEEGP